MFKEKKFVSKTFSIPLPFLLLSVYISMARTCSSFNGGYYLHYSFINQCPY